jgi:hypothetical protein
MDLGKRVCEVDGVVSGSYPGAGFCVGGEPSGSVITQLI